jgi:hypothetical protein
MSILLSTKNLTQTHKLATRAYQKSHPICSDYEAVTRNNRLNMSRITWRLDIRL